MEEFEESSLEKSRNECYLEKSKNGRHVETLEGGHVAQKS